MIVSVGEQCSCHDWRPLDEIGGWLQHEVAVRERAAQPQIWQPGFYALSRDELRHRVRTAGGIPHEYALQARRECDGHIELLDGVHRWAIAAELGLGPLPVRITDAIDSSMYAP